jgi:hypothetical protein
MHMSMSMYNNMYMHMHMYNMHAKLHMCSAQHAHTIWRGEQRCGARTETLAAALRMRRGGARGAKVGGRQPDERGGQATARVLWEARQKLPCVPGGGGPGGGAKAE